MALHAPPDVHPKNSARGLTAPCCASPYTPLPHDTPPPTPPPHYTPPPLHPPAKTRLAFSGRVPGAGRGRPAGGDVVGSQRCPTECRHVRKSYFQPNRGIGWRDTVSPTASTDNTGRLFLSSGRLTRSILGTLKGSRMPDPQSNCQSDLEIIQSLLDTDTAKGALGVQIDVKEFATAVRDLRCVCSVFESSPSDVMDAWNAVSRAAGAAVTASMLRSLQSWIWIPYSHGKAIGGFRSHDDYTVVWIGRESHVVASAKSKGGLTTTAFECRNN